MKRRVFLAAFESQAGVLAAVQLSRERGWRIADVYAPYPVHGLSPALALPASRLSRVTFVVAVASAVLMAYFEFWVSAIDWPINIGGKPWNSLPAFMPPIFEAMVLSAAVGTFVAFAIVCRLRPGKPPSPLVRGATDLWFVLALEASDAVPDPALVRELFAPLGVRHVEEQPQEIG